MIAVLFLFFIFGVLGWSFEKLQGKQPCDTILRKLTGTCPPFLTIYGLGVVILYVLSRLDVGYVSLFALSFIIINVFECLVGKLSYLVNGYETWDYPDTWFTLCDGYLSLPSMLVFGSIGGILAVLMSRFI